MNEILQYFSDRIPVQKHVYLVIPSSVCKGCYAFDTAGLSIDFTQNFQIVSSIDTGKFVGFFHTLRDTDDRLVRKPFLDYGIKFILTDAGKVQSVIPLVNFERQADSLTRFFLR
ncbi:MAG: hypothetical protein QM743_05500 [Chitinophagaceae bacterium]